jgi:hypothetical protein
VASNETTSKHDPSVEEPMDTARRIVAEYFNARAEVTDEYRMGLSEPYVVWFCFILGGWKALVSTPVVDGMYYEVTHNIAVGQTYLDAYKKFDNQLVN